jgi:hypothetical protein
MINPFNLCNPFNSSFGVKPTDINNSEQVKANANLPISVAQL